MLNLVLNSEWSGALPRYGYYKASSQNRQCSQIVNQLHRNPTEIQYAGG